MLPRARFGALLLAGALLGLPLNAQPSPVDESVRVKHVTVMGSGAALEIEIQTSTRLVPESQTITSPDRIVIDFPGARPAAELRTMAVNRGALKQIRAGLFSANPPITRVVLDLSEPQPYQIFTNGNRVMLKLGMTAVASSNSAALMAVSAQQTGGSAPMIAVAAQQAVTPVSPMTVNFQHGLLRIHAKGATLADVLFEVQRLTGAEIPIPAGAEQEVIAAELGPAPPQDVLAALLNGSRYNFIFVDGDHNHSLQKAILSVR